MCFIPNYEIAEIFKILDNRIEESSFEKLMETLCLWLEEHIFFYYMDDRNKISELISIVKHVLEKTIKKYLKTFGYPLNMIRYTLAKYYSPDDEFNSEDLYEKIKRTLFYFEETKLCKAFANERGKNKDHYEILERANYKCNKKTEFLIP